MEGRGSAAGHLAVVAMVLVLVMAPGALAANHVVGNTTQQWNFPPSNDLSYYTTWAASQTFAVGDTLEFEYSAAEHDVVQYTSNTTLAEYNACNGTTEKTYTTGNDSIPLTIAGTYYFICGIPGHCAEGMKVSVNVSAAASPPTTTPTPPTSTSPPPPPNGNGASSGPVMSMAGLLIAALVASLAFLV